jgi:hypothetical protein
MGLAAFRLTHGTIKDMNVLVQFAGRLLEVMPQ